MERPVVKAITVRAPWWFWIVHGVKSIENRSWRTTHRGALAIHAARWFDADTVQSDIQRMRQKLNRRGVALIVPALADLARLGGCIVGTATLADVIDSSSSPWFDGPYGFVLQDARFLRRPIEARGAQGLFDVTLKAVRRGI